MEHSPRLNGFKPRSYGDVIAVATLLAMFMSVVTWGLKLEGEVDLLREQLSQTRSQVGNGILPRAEERIDAMQKEIDELKDNAR